MSRELFRGGPGFVPPVLPVLIGLGLGHKHHHDGHKQNQGDGALEDGSQQPGDRVIQSDTAPVVIFQKLGQDDTQHAGSHRVFKTFQQISQNPEVRGKKEEKGDRQ